MSQSYCITFAGAVGSSKTPIASYLSWNLNLPVFNNDAIRSEVQEDLLQTPENIDPQVYEERKNSRLTEIFKSKKNFIYDISVDRAWLQLKEMLISQNYKWFLISNNLSEEFLLRLYGAKGYTETNRLKNEWIPHHEAFLKQYARDIGLNIDDDNFMDRLNLSLEAVKKFINE